MTGSFQACLRHDWEFATDRFGSASCEGCTGLNGPNPGLSLGGTINNRLILGVGATSFSKSDVVSTVTIGTIDARLRFYPVRRSGFFTTGGLGVGAITEDILTDYGVGVVFGLGWDIRMTRNLSFTPFWNGVVVSNAAGRVGSAQFGAGITIH